MRSWASAYDEECSDCLFTVTDDLTERINIKIYKSLGFTLLNRLLEVNRNFTVLYKLVTSWLHCGKKNVPQNTDKFIETSKWPQVSQAHSYITSSLLIDMGFWYECWEEMNLVQIHESIIQVHHTWKSRALSARKLRDKKDWLLLEFMVSTFTITTDIFWDTFKWTVDFWHCAVV